MQKYFIFIIFVFLFVSLSAAETKSSYPFLQNIFNPELSLIVDTSFAGSSVEDHDRLHFEMPGFTDHLHAEGKTKGFNFNYLELSFFAPVDPCFELFAVVAYEHDELEVEEAYVNTLGLPHGFNVRLGKFLSAFGRLNEQHKHYWDFYDTPLAYESILGPHGISNTGIRVFWTAPVNFYLTIGAEILQGSFDHNPTFSNDGFTFGNTIEIKSAA